MKRPFSRSLLLLLILGDSQVALAELSVQLLSIVWSIGFIGCQYGMIISEAKLLGCNC